MPSKAYGDPPGRGGNSALVLKLFLFLFVGGVAGIGYSLIGGSPDIVPLVIVLAGAGAVAAVAFVEKPPV